MKAMKIALLGTAALAAVSVSARADNLSDLKAQIEALNARVASIETTPSMPAGYSAVSFSKDGNKHIISIMPTADMPAATTITWSGYVRAALISNYGGVGGYYSTDVVSRAYLTVEGKTDTAVGEVGAKINFMGNSYGVRSTNTGNNYLTTDGYWGWWKMTPNLTFGGGVGGSLAKNNYVYDAAGAGDYYISTGGPLSNNNYGDPSQLRLTYADGPLSVAVALEDGNNSANSSAVGGAAKIAYAMDSFAFDLSGGYWGNSETGASEDNAWVVSAGAQFTAGAFTVGGAVGMGSNDETGDNYTKAGVFANMHLGDQAVASLGYTETWYTQGTTYQTYTISGGLYYNPVSKLTIGAEGSYTGVSNNGSGDGAYVADLVSIWRF